MEQLSVLAHTATMPPLRARSVNVNFLWDWHLERIVGRVKVEVVAHVVAVHVRVPDHRVVRVLHGRESLVGLERC